MSQRPSILGFFGEYRYLSNFHLADIVFEGDTYPASENAYMSAKTIDRKDRTPFFSATPKDAKKLGRLVPLRPDWEQIKIGVMCEILCYKFSPQHHPDLAQKLLDTGDAYLEETNYWHDVFWGSCTCNKHKDTPGQNNLGRILMQIRSALQHDRNQQGEIG